MQRHPIGAILLKLRRHRNVTWQNKILRNCSDEGPGSIDANRWSPDPLPSLHAQMPAPGSASDARGWHLPSVCGRTLPSTCVVGISSLVAAACTSQMIDTTTHQSANMCKKKRWWYLSLLYLRGYSPNCNNHPPSYPKGPSHRSSQESWCNQRET